MDTSFLNEGEDRGRATSGSKRGRVTEKDEDGKEEYEHAEDEGGGGGGLGERPRDRRLQPGGDKAEIIRRRNCENARKARARKKKEVSQLQEQATQLKMERLNSRERARKAKEAEIRTVALRKRAFRTFMRYRCSNERSYSEWADIVEETFTMTLPITPYRWFSCRDVLNNSRVVRGIDHLMTDNGSLAVLIESFGSGTLPWRKEMERGEGHEVKLVCDVRDEDMVTSGDTLICWFQLRTTNAIEHGAKCEWLCRGMMSVKFARDPLSHKIAAAEHVFDVASLMQQLQKVIGDQQCVPVVPNTPGGACQPSTEARVITTSTPPFPVVRCNESWSKLCGYDEDNKEGRTLGVLPGPDTDMDALKTLIREVQKGQAASSLLVNYKNDGSSFLNYLRVYPLGDPTGTVTHFLGVPQEQAEYPDHDGDTSTANNGTPSETWSSSNASVAPSSSKPAVAPVAAVTAPALPVPAKPPPDRKEATDSSSSLAAIKRRESGGKPNDIAPTRRPRQTRGRVLGGRGGEGRSPDGQRGGPAPGPLQQQVRMDSGPPAATNTPRETGRIGGVPTVMIKEEPLSVDFSGQGGGGKVSAKGGVGARARQGRRASAGSGSGACDSAAEVVEQGEGKPSQGRRVRRPSQPQQQQQVKPMGMAGEERDLLSQLNRDTVLKEDGGSAGGVGEGGGATKGTRQQTQTPPLDSGYPRRAAGAEDEVNSLGNISSAPNSVDGAESPESLLAWEDVLGGPEDPLEELGTLDVEDGLEEAVERVTDPLQDFGTLDVQEGLKEAVERVTTRPAAGGDGGGDDERRRACSDSAMSGGSTGNRMRGCAWRLGTGAWEGAGAGGGTGRPDGCDSELWGAPVRGWDAEGNVEAGARDHRTVSDSATWGLIPLGGATAVGGADAMGLVSRCGARSASGPGRPSAIAEVATAAGVEEVPGSFSLGQKTLNRGGSGGGAGAGCSEIFGDPSRAAAGVNGGGMVLEEDMTAPANCGDLMLTEEALFRSTVAVPDTAAAAAAAAGRGGAGMDVGGVANSAWAATLPTLNLFDPNMLGALPFGSLAGYSGGPGSGGPGSSGPGRGGPWDGGGSGRNFGVEGVLSDWMTAAPGLGVGGFGAEAGAQRPAALQGSLGSMVGPDGDACAGAVPPPSIPGLSMGPGGPMLWGGAFSMWPALMEAGSSLPAEQQLPLKGMCAGGGERSAGHGAATQERPL